ncbi:immunoglobulin-like domain-containing protein [Clostridium sartagoforme]|uniref:immunoglobulin-like domain-containing protein n=1 Tax=Clostridium sartagoforme TaxID=84031 RepID=UPI0031D35155
MKKKILCFLIIIIVFMNTLPAYAQSDTTPPVINNITISNKEEVRPGDTLNIIIEASDTESGFDENTYCEIDLYNGNRKINYLKPKYNANTGYFELNYKIPSDMQNGNWWINSVFLYDKANNHVLLKNSDREKYNFNVISDITDVTPPSINNVNILNKEAKPGDTLGIIIEVSDDDSGFDLNTYCEVSLYNGSRMINFLEPKYNANTGNYELNYKIPSDVQNGNWWVRSIYLNDKAGNYTLLNNLDQTKYNFKVINYANDNTAPSIDNVNILNNEVMQGDTLGITIKASDMESGFDANSYCKVDLYNGSRMINFLEPKYNENTGNFELNYKIPSDMQSGNWWISNITLFDKAENYKVLNNSDKTQYNFNVKSSFNGTENKVIKKGEEFSPLKGVNFFNNLEGDLTNKLECYGQVDINKEGLYLIKYLVKGNNGDIYEDYRWITVCDTESVGNLSYFKSDIEVNISGIDDKILNIVKGGQEYNNVNDGILNEEGEYTISLKDITKARSNEEGDKAISFVIDKTLPVIDGIKIDSIIEDEKVQASQFLNASDNRGQVNIEFVSEPNWSQVGLQNITLGVKDLAGNYIEKTIEVNIKDKCDLNDDGIVDILDLSDVSLKYNKKKDEINWNSRLDFNKDNIIDIFDLVLCTKRIK